MSMDDATTVIDEKVRQSVTIGLNPSNTFESIDSVAKELDHKAERANMANEYRKAEAALKGTGKLPISIDNKCLLSMQDGRDT